MIECSIKFHRVWERRQVKCSSPVSDPFVQFNGDIYWTTTQPKPRKHPLKYAKFQPSCVFNDSRAALQENLHRGELKQAKGNVKQNIPDQSYPSGFALLCVGTYGRGGAEALHPNKLTR